MARLTLFCFLVIIFSVSSYGYEFPKIESAKRYASSLVSKASSLVGKQISKPSLQREPVLDCTEDGLFSHPTDCRLYVRCIMGKPHVIECDSELHFNKDTKRCEDPCSAGCDKDIQDCNWVRNERVALFDMSAETKSIEDSTGEPHMSDDMATVTCPLRGSLYVAHPSDCTKYIFCDSGTAHLKTCPQEKHFNKMTSKCETLCKAGCDPNLHCGAASELTTDDTSSELNKLDVPFLCPRGRWLANYPGDCTKYISCYNGIPFVVNCHQGLHFNINTKRCELPCDAECDKTIQCKWRSFKNSFMKKQSLSNFECSQDGLFPNPEDCGSYVVCSNGANQAMECPEGLHFNSESQICERPCDARCNSSLSEECNWSESAFPETAKMSPLKQPVFDFTCEHDGIFENVHACESFIQCSYGSAYLLNCPFGQHYNAEKGYCMSPCEAKCDPNYDCEEEQQAQPERRRLFDFSCETDGFHSNPLDCETFIQCFKGEAYEIDCPKGLHYSHERQICVAPCEARCMPYYEMFCSYENSETSAPRAPEYDFACNSDAIYQNPRDCTSYIKCERGQAYAEPCPAGLHYSEDTQTCVKPCDAECDPSFATECGWDKPWVSEKHSQSPEFSDNTEKLSFEYSAVDLLAQKYNFKCIHDSVYKHPGNCGLYIVCDHLIPHIMSCPKGLHWSQQLKRCDWPCEAHCNSSLACECGWKECKKTDTKTEYVDCEAEPEIGPCKAKKPRYYYDKEAGQCKIFYYGGCQGNSNNFLTESDCRQKCQDKILAQKDDIDCEAEPETGPCKGNMPRYYYDREAGQCKIFYYGGCQGNSNNFLTESDCREKCQDKMLAQKDDIDCEAEPETGPCEGNMPRYYYDREAGQCKIFYYGGCQGNSNNFLTESDCREKCQDKMLAQKDDIDCEAEPETGPCKGNMPRYYYDREAGQCKIFYYGGCQGNSNNFLTESDCREKCQDKMLGDFECPSNNGRYGHYPDCLSYYHCKRGVPTLKKCPKGLAFDHLKSKCVKEHEATCVYKCEESDATYPHDENCHKYIDCVNGVSKVEKCPPGEAFDPEKRDCVDERQVSTCHWS